MKWDKVKYLQYKYLGEWYRQKDIDDTISHKQSKMYSKFVSCGNIIKINNRWVTYQCRLITCPSCSKCGAERLAKKFLAQYPLRPQSEFRQVTLGLGFVYEPEEGFCLFKEARDKLYKIVNNKRRSDSEKMKPWQSYSMVGTLDWTSFKVSDFERLGSTKKDRFTNQYGFNPRSTNQENAFEPHVHGIIHCDILDKMVLLDVLAGCYSSVYIDDLHNHQSLDVNVNTYLEYSSKVRFATKFADGKLIDWDKSQVKSYGEAVALERGQVCRQMFIGDKTFCKLRK